MEIKINKIRAYAYEWVCPKCNKRFVSLYEEQLKSWVKEHMKKHGKK